jgi:hypothetical protein
MTPLEIQGAMAAVITSAFILVATVTAGGICRNYSDRETQPGNKSLVAEDSAVKKRCFSCEAVLNAMVGTQMRARMAEPSEAPN